MTTFIDFRYSRALAAALFTGQEKEEAEIIFEIKCDNYVALEIGASREPRQLARFVGSDNSLAVTLNIDNKDTVSLCDRDGKRLAAVQLHSHNLPLIGVRIGPSISGLKASDGIAEVKHKILGTGFTDRTNSLKLECMHDVKVMGQGTGRAMRWGQLFYHRIEPLGLCVELTMDWHHLRAGIPLFSTMTAEELVDQGVYRLRFRSYAYEEADAETTDFVRLFGCNDPADIAFHLTPALYGTRVPGIPNLAFVVIESSRVHPHLVRRCNRMDRICVPSTFTRRTLVRNVVIRPIDVVSHGVDSEYFRPVKEKQPLPGGCGFNFLAIGTHVERKNIRHLVHAFLKEFTEHEDVALFLFLRPEYHSTQNNIALEFTEWEREWAHDSAQIFLWTGYLTREHLRDFYANADAYVMPSNEGFGLTLLEAMSCGTPAIGLNHGGVVDFLNLDNGILVPVGRSYAARDIDTLPYVGDRFCRPDIARLRQAMRHLFEKKEEVASLGARARADAEKLTWKIVTRHITEVIKRTYTNFHSINGGRMNNSQSPTNFFMVSPPLILVLCVLDDADARKSLDYLRGSVGDCVQVLCLFTRYARLRDVMRARKYGFVYYRWDGTIENSKIIARSIFGRNWIAILNPGEKIIGDMTALTDFLKSQPPEIVEVSISCGEGQAEPRLFHVRPEGGPSEKTEYTGVIVRPAAA